MIPSKRSPGPSIPA